MRKNFLRGKKKSASKWQNGAGRGITICNPYWNNYQARIITDTKATWRKIIDEKPILIMPEYHPTDYTVIAKWKMYAYSGDVAATSLTKWSNSGVGQPGNLRLLMWYNRTRQLASLFKESASWNKDERTLLNWNRLRDMTTKCYLWALIRA